MGEKRDTFFTQDRAFYRSLFSIFVMVALQNLVAYSVNMIDNVMMGSYSQTSLSGAATVNQIFFLVQQLAITVCDSLIILASQYYGQGRMSPVRKITGLALKLGLGIGLFFSVACALFPARILGFFTRDMAIVEQGTRYMQIILFTFPLFILTNVLMAALRCAGTVKISFYISVVSLFINTGINYTLIFGHFGFPEMGIRGAAIGTLTARLVEFLIVFIYVRFRDRKLELFSEPFLSSGRRLAGDFIKVAVPVIIMGMIWAISVPLQTAILGHLPGGRGQGGRHTQGGRLRHDRRKFCLHDFLSVSESGRERHGIRLRGCDGTVRRQRGYAEDPLRCPHPVGGRRGNRSGPCVFPVCPAHASSVPLQSHT